jgi:hypothetical protein
MARRQPDGLPDVFLDRSLGRLQVPELLRAGGVRLRTLAEVYGVPADEAVSDIEWLTRAGAEGWPVLMKDERIRYRPAERAAVLSASVQAFCLTNGNLLAARMAEIYLAALDKMELACRAPGPSLYAVSVTGLRRVEL